MKLIIQPTAELKGEVKMPGSKSHSIRAILFALLARGKSKVSHLLDSEDTRAAVSICRKLGAKIKVLREEKSLDVIVTGTGTPMETRAKKLFSGNSGITTTFCIPIAGLRRNKNPLLFDCGKQMRTRPIKPILDAVRKLGMKIHSLNQNEKLPAILSGNLRGGSIKIDGENSQNISSLLISLPLVREDSKITVHNLCERPYVEMTLERLKKAGIQIKHERQKNKDVFSTKGGQNIKNFNTDIPADFSSASCVIAAAILAKGHVNILGLNMKDVQGDKKLIYILQDMGADMRVRGKTIIIHGGKPLRGIEIDCSDIPDLLPALAVIGTQAEGKTILKNLKPVKAKETDRIKSMANGLRKMGAKIQINGTSMIVHKSRLYRSRLNGYGDHRTVMALSVACMLADGESEITTAESIKKTFPDFVTLMNSIDANMHFKK